ncbi:two-component regulator propeller domain-containing protein [Paraflavisolibacter sp. H34]|uniref:ligand-binding sensor domain-containing protein n=1 Tax=Huijunlia imazamoxiresistens TaxID=3127457 RepID=UPI00301730B8
MLVRVKGFLLFLFLLVAGASGAQVKCTLRHYSANEGLSDNRILCGIRDREGFMWFGTWVGLCRFDGNGFKAYQSLPGDHSSLKNNRINALMEDAEGYLWLIADDEQVYRFDKQREEFAALTELSPLKELKAARVGGYQSAGNREIWLQASNGLYLLRVLPGGAVRVSRYAAGEAASFSLPSATIDLVSIPDSAHVWVGTRGGLVLLEKRNGMFRRSPKYKELAGQRFTTASSGRELQCFGTEQGDLVLFNPKTGGISSYKISGERLQALRVSGRTGAIYATTASGDLLTVSFPGGALKKEVFRTGRPLYSLFEDSRGLLWIEPGDKGVYKYDPQKKAGRYFSYSHSFKGLEDKRDYRVLEDREGRVWVNMRADGFGYYDRQRDTLQFTYEDFQGIHPFHPTSSILFYDPSGILWLTSSLGGAQKYVLSRSHFRQDLLNKDDPAREENVVRGMMEDRKGRLWMGPRGARLYLPATGPVPPPLLEGPVPERVYTLLEDRQGTVWMGTKGQGLFRAQPADSGRTRYRLQQFAAGDGQGLSSNLIYTLLQDRKGRIWAGSFEKGLILVEPSPGGLRFKTTDNFFRGYPGGAYSRIRHLAEDTAGNIWIGTTGGLLVFNPDRAGQGGSGFALYRKEPGNGASLGDNDVQFIYRDSRGQMWVLTSSGGLNRAVGDPLRSLRFTNYSTRNGLRSNCLLSCTEDRKGNLWIAAQNGISRFSPRTHSFRNFDMYDGLSDISLSEASVLRRRNGEILFGTVTGYLSFDPEAVETEKVPGSIVLTDVLVNNRDLEPESGYAPARNINYIDKLVLEHYQNNISVFYTVLDYRYEDRVQYQFRLLGYDTAWQNNRRLRKATYTNLDPGTYAFEVRTVEKDFYKNIPLKRLTLVIRPPWWKTAWAYGGYAVLLAALLLVVKRIAVTLLRLRQGIAIERKMTELKMNFFTQVSHEIRTPLSLVINPLEETLKTETLSPKGVEYLDLVLRNARRMLRFFNQLLDLRKVQSGMAELHLQKVELIAFLKKEAEYFIRAAQQRGISIELLAEGTDLYASIDPEKMDIVLYNLLSNAMKFSPDGGCIFLILEKGLLPGEVYIRVKDEGPGVKEAQLKNIFTLYYEGGQAKNRAIKGTGIGLALAKELVELHGGHISAENAASQGLVVTITLPLGGPGA